MGRDPGGREVFRHHQEVSQCPARGGSGLSDEEISYFLLVNQQNASELSISGDIIFIHDPQPIALIEKKSDLGNKWLWRCHIDFSKPIPSIWNFLRPYIERYDSAVFSAPAFARQLLTKQVLVSPPSTL